MPIEGMVLQLDFVRQAALVNYQGSAALALVVDEPPADWRAQLSCRCQLPVLLRKHIPLDPRHNTKIDRRRLQVELGQSPQNLL